MSATNEQIADILKTATLHANTYIQDAFHAMSYMDNDITWSEKDNTYIVCGRKVKVTGIDGLNGTVTFIIYSDNQPNFVMCNIVEKSEIMIEALKQQIVDEEDRIKSLDENIEKLYRDDAVQNSYVTIGSRSTGLDVDTDDMSTDTLQTILDLVRRDLEDIREEKYRIIKELNEKLDKLNKVWEWSLPTPAMWADFDCGTVEAPTYEEAFTKARKELTKSVNEVNVLLGGKCTISIDANQITLTEVR